MKRKVITFVIILICFLLECTIFTKLSFATIKPNLLLIVTSSLGLIRGRKKGMAVGLVSGFFADMFWRNSLGYYMLLFAVIGYINGSFRRLFFDEDIKLPLILIAVSELIYGIVNYVCFYMLQGDFAFATFLFQIILPELVYTVLVTLILYQIILKINKKLEVEEQRSASKFV